MVSLTSVTSLQRLLLGLSVSTAPNRFFCKLLLFGFAPPDALLFLSEMNTPVGLACQETVGLVSARQTTTECPGLWPLAQT